jgi:hypothetical protein
MKKQINPKIKAHLLRSALVLLPLVAICALPFALGKSRGGPSSKAARPTGVCPAPWQEVAPMTTDLYGDACASDGTFVYCGGGYSFSSGNTLAVFNRYDPVANSWMSLPDMPQSAIMAVAVYYPPTNKIYVFGGEDAVSGTNYNITRIYDIAGNTWSTGANMPDVRSFSAGGYVPATGKIYILSGYNTGTVGSAQPNTWEYDPVADSWTDLTGTVPYPHPAGGFAFGVINNKLYTAGGRDAANLIINDTWEFDPTVPAYTQKTDEPGFYQNNVPGSGVALDALWVFGGGNPFAIGAGANQAASRAAFPFKPVKGARNPKIPATDNQTRFYDPSTDTWGAFSSMNEFRSFPGGTGIGNTLVATGGYNGSTTLSSVETVAACFPTPTPPQCDTGLIQNGGFETGDFTSWVIDGTSNPPVVNSDNPHTGTFAALAGDIDPSPEPTGDSSFYQEFTVPAGTSTLTFWHWNYSSDVSIVFDWQDAYITDTSGTILQTIFHVQDNSQTWLNTNVDMTPYAGQTVRVKFLVHQDGFGDDTGMYVDDVELTVPCASPTPTPTPAVRATPTPRPRPTPLPRPR